MANLTNEVIGLFQAFLDGLNIVSGDLNLAVMGATVVNVCVYAFMVAVPFGVLFKLIDFVTGGFTK